MGERFGNYEILRRIAAGGMAEVFLAKQRGIGGFERLVCIKRILPHLGEQDDFIKMFQDEARIAANLIHPNVAQIYDIGEVDGAYYIAMEYVRGEDLRRIYNQEVARGRAMPPEPASQIIMGAAAGLDYAHRQTTIDGRPLNIVHRDISPQNILVTYDGHVKLVDFGVAKAAGKMTETRTGVLKGKYSYMSPEQASGDPVDARTDIFALGITLYEVTTGVRLFKRDNEIETLHAVIECNVTTPSEVLPGYDPELEQIVMRALSFNPDDRFPTAGEMARALEEMLIRRGHATGASSLGEYMQDLFAEKLADELLLGSQVFDDPKRSGSKQGQANGRFAKLSQQHAPTDPDGGSQSTAPDPVRDPTEAIGPQGDTVIEASELVKNSASHRSASRESRRSGQQKQRSGPKARRSAPHEAPPKDDWAQKTEGSAMQTATRDAPVEALRSSRQHPLLEQPAPRPTPARPNRPVWLFVGIFALVLLVPAAVWLFSGGEPAKTHTGPLVVESEPRGARVLFEGPGADDLNARFDASGLRTPFTIQEGVPIVAGLKARFLKDGYEIAERELTGLAAGQTPPPLYAELKSSAPAVQPATLNLLTTPPGATAIVDGTPLDAKTPVKELRVAGATNHTIELRLIGYQTRIEPVFLEAGERRFIDVRLTADPSTVASPTPPPDQGTITPVPSPPNPPPTSPGGDGDDGDKPSGGGGGHAYLTVSSSLKVKVFVGNRLLGETPVQRVAVESGSQRLRFESDAEGFVIRRKVRLTAGRIETIDLKPQKGGLSVNATPWAKVRVGKGAAAETPTRLQLYEGEYDVFFECPDGKKKTQTATVSPGENTAITVNCRE